MSKQLESLAAHEASILGFLQRQYMRAKPTPASIKLTGQTTVITGANSGLGFEASIQLLELGLSRLVMGVRSQAKGDEAASKLRAKFPTAIVEVWLLDMASYDSITAFAKKCESLQRLDIAILNAGAQYPTYQTLSSTNHEMTMQVNYLSTALLSILLAPVIKSKKAEPTSPGRLTLVASDTSYMISPKFPPTSVLAHMDKEQGYSMFNQYATSKLLVQWFITKLAQEVDPNDVVVNMVNPGMCGGTQLGHQERSWLAIVVLDLLHHLLARAPEVGASIYVDAVAVKGPETHGSYVSDWTIKPYPKILYTEEGHSIEQRLWQETMEELNFAGASKILADMRH